MNKEDFIFWRLANFFITEQGYRIIQLFENQKELWLEKLENKNVPIVRLFINELNWSNALHRDIEFTATNGENIRKQLHRGDLTLANIYISPYPPVDDYEYRLEKPYIYPEGNKTSIISILLADGKYDSGFETLSRLLERQIVFEINEEYSEETIHALKKLTLETAVKQAESEKAVFENGRPLFTYFFIIVQILVFFWLEMHGGSTNNATLIKYGAKFNPLIYEGEWWRFITPIFLHIGFLHLAMNTLALYYLGVAVERLYGNIRFLFIYLFAGIAGVIASFIFSSNISAGASGAIYGCFGALLYFGMIQPKLFFRTMGLNLIVVLGINLVFSFYASGIDSAGHLGGLAGGFLTAGIVYLPKQKRIFLQAIFFLLSAAIIWGALTYGFSTNARTRDEGSSLALAQDYIKQDQFDQAYQVLKDTEKKLKSPTANLYFLLSYTEIKKGMFPVAKTHLEKAIELTPNFDEAYYNLAFINIEEKDFKQAKINAEKALKLNPDRKEYSDLVKKINEHLSTKGAE
ncbi:rhomboid family intramembrane serine protease [Bacillus sp. MUM 116]|uniref:rhomboid family protein n=1 Tax=Bacillus sp. MUM 116 TaxID=1678002 RepID=UPI0008F5E9A3|nr:rhomboid family intramembrane serine protease [Bacillus sp. MUM 116]OIK11776.1 rhomboid family intramembrane serine protease [Bacillus sp. MUM 116]